MDINEINKPIHIRCPKCKADLEYNPRKIRDRLQIIKDKYASLGRKIREAKNPMERHKILCERKKLDFQIRLLKEDNNLMSELLKEQTYKILRRLLKQRIGEAEYMDLLHKAEEMAREENVFYTYELAIQNYSNIMDSVVRKEDEAWQTTQN